MTKNSTKEAYKYVLIGGGMGAGFATLGIRDHDKEGSILIVSNESHVPYERPALSKKLWRDDEFNEEDTKIGAEKEGNTDFKFDTSVTQIDRENRTITLSNDEVVQYDQLLISTGGEPNSIEGPKDKAVFTFRSLDDYQNLRDYSGDNQHVIIVGGGYIGSELAASLSINNTQVTIVFPQNELGEDMFPSELLREYNKLFKDHNVALVNGKRAEKYQRDGDKLMLTLDDGSELEGDAVVIGLGVKPRIQLAEEAGFDIVNDGVVVNEYLKTNDPNIWAAADIATYPDAIFGQQRIEHVDHARNSGRAVGANMAGANQPYTHTPYLYSMLYSLSWEAIGTLDPSLETLFDHREGGDIVFYLDEDKLVGVLLWNVTVDLDDVRAILDNPPKNKEDLIGVIEEKSDDK